MLKNKIFIKKSKEIFYDVKKDEKYTPMNIQSHNSKRDSICVGAFLFLYLLAFSRRILYSHGNMIDVYCTEKENILKNSITFTRTFSSQTIHKGPFFIKMDGIDLTSTKYSSKFINYETAITIFNNNISYIVKQCKGKIFVGENINYLDNITIFNGYMPSFEKIIISTTLTCEQEIRIKELSYYIYYNREKDRIAFIFQIFATIGIILTIYRMLKDWKKVTIRTSIEFFETVAMDITYFISSVATLFSSLLPYKVIQLVNLFSTIYCRFMALFVVVKLSLKEKITATILAMFFAFISCTSQVYDIMISTIVDYKASKSAFYFSFSYTFVSIFFFIYEGFRSTRSAKKVYIETSAIFLSSAIFSNVCFANGNDIIVRENIYYIQRIVNFVYCIFLSEMHSLGNKYKKL